MSEQKPGMDETAEAKAKLESLRPKTGKGRIIEVQPQSDTASRINVEYSDGSSHWWTIENRDNLAGPQLETLREQKATVYIKEKGDGEHVFVSVVGALLPRH